MRKSPLLYRFFKLLNIYDCTQHLQFPHSPAVFQHSSLKLKLMIILWWHAFILFNHSEVQYLFVSVISRSITRTHSLKQSLSLDGCNNFCLSLTAENSLFFCWQSKQCKIKCSQTCSSLLIVAIKLTLMEIRERKSHYCLAFGNTEHLMHWSIIIIFILFCDFHRYCSLIACARIRRILEWCSLCWYLYCRWCSKTLH